MLARQFRLPATVSFQKARVLYSPYFTVRVVANELSFNRYGFLAGKKLDKRAVMRNKVKRRVRAIVEKEGLALKGRDLIFLLKASVKDVTYPQLLEAVRGILQQLP